MGELHLEIVKERLQRVYRVPCELGPLKVAYREGIALEVGATSESIPYQVTLLVMRCAVNCSLNKTDTSQLCGCYSYSYSSSGQGYRCDL